MKSARDKRGNALHEQGLAPAAEHEVHRARAGARGRVEKQRERQHPARLLRPAGDCFRLQAQGRFSFVNAIASLSGSISTLPLLFECCAHSREESLDRG